MKTLHPKVHGGILADRSNPSHLADLEAQHIEPIDLVVCNLYPFSSDPSIETDRHRRSRPWSAPRPRTTRTSVSSSTRPTTRSSSRSCAPRARCRATPVGVWPAPPLRTPPPTTPPSWSGSTPVAPVGDPELLPPTLHLALERAEELRYGENPHQRGARYRDRSRPTWWDGVVQHGGTALSYLNLFDTDAAWRLVAELAPVRSSAVAIIKHANPCGAALAPTLAEAYRRAPAVRPGLGLRRRRRPGWPVHAPRWRRPWPRVPRPT